MRRMSGNFDAQGTAMHMALVRLRMLVAGLFPAFQDYITQRDAVHLLFCYRWLLLDFRREFAMEDVS